MRCSPRIALAAVAVATAALAACSTGGSDAGGTTTAARGGSTTTAAPATTTTDEPAPSTTVPSTTAPPATTTAPAPTTAAGRSSVATDDPLDWDGTKWDYGDVVAARHDDTSIILSFDRYQVVQADGSWGEGPSLNREPLVYANTDVPYKNTSAKRRDYRIYPNARIEVLTNALEVCRGRMGEGPEVGPRWQEVNPADVVAWSAQAADLAPPGFTDPGQDDVTFDAEGVITQLRFLEPC